ncbi:MAG: AMP-binding protein [Burkholderiales bacterium]|nr:AMP-binding protein [Burkholderiales bacterium]
MSETIVAAVRRHARERPAALALADARVRLNWRETAQWMDKGAGWLAARHLARGAPVLGWLPNCAEWFLLRLACERAGLFWVPVPASQGSRELASIVARVRPAVAVSAARYRERDYSVELDAVLALQGLTPLRVTLPGEDLLRLEGAPPDPGTEIGMQDDAHALATTGSEGIPKLAVYTLDAACRRAHAQAELLGLTPQDVLLVLSPGVGPARAAWLAGHVAGCCIVTMARFGADAALGLIASERPTIVCGTPSQLAMLAADLGRVDVTSVRFWYTAGSVLPATLAETLEAQSRGRVISTYGGADFGGWAAPAPQDPPSVRHRSVGRPRGGTEFRIVDQAGRDLAPGEAGELIGRGPCCVTGYLGEAGRERWRDGWFHTGDLASRDAQGNITIAGRLKNVIMRGGDNVSPAEVEELLRTVAGIAEAAVVGVADPVLGERVCACVVPAAGAAPDLETLRARLHVSGLAHYKIPERLVVLEALPSVGDKVDRRALSALAAARLSGAA